MNFLSAALTVLLIPNTNPLLISKAFNSQSNQLICQSITPSRLATRSESLCLAAIDPEQIESEGKNVNRMNLPGGWWGIGVSSDIRERPVALKRFGMNLVLWRGSDGKLNIFEDRCPHASVKFSIGQVVLNEETNERCLQCPAHGLQFDDQGKCAFDPEDKKSKPFLRVPKIVASESNGVIWMKWGTDDAPEPDSLKDLNSYYTIGVKINSKANFRLNIENLLDADHVDFVHENTFSRIAKFFVKRKKTNWEMTSTGVKWHNGDPEFNFTYEFPNTWTNRRHAEDAVSIIIAPVDAVTTDVYIRMHRNFLNEPILRDLFDPLFKFIYHFVAMEDQRIMDSQQDNENQVRPATDHLYRRDDQRRRFFRAWLKGKRPFQGPLYDQPSFETPVDSNEKSSDEIDSPKPDSR